jgi:hypothetical protein
VNLRKYPRYRDNGCRAGDRRSRHENEKSHVASKLIQVYAARITATLQNQLQEFIKIASISESSRGQASEPFRPFLKAGAQTGVAL